LLFYSKNFTQLLDIKPLRTKSFSLLKKICGCLFLVQTASTLHWYKVFGKNVLLPNFGNVTNLLQWSTRVLISGRLCAFNQAWKPSLKVRGAQIAFLGRMRSSYCIFEKLFFYLTKLLWGHKNFGGIAPECPQDYGPT